MDLSNFEKFMESEHYEVYLPKNCEEGKQIEMIVKYKRNGMFMRTLLTDALFKLFFKPEDYKKIYMKDPKNKVR